MYMQLVIYYTDYICLLHAPAQGATYIEHTRYTEHTKRTMLKLGSAVWPTTQCMYITS